MVPAITLCSRKTPKKNFAIEEEDFLHTTQKIALIRPVLYDDYVPFFFCSFFQINTRRERERETLVGSGAW